MKHIMEMLNVVEIVRQPVQPALLAPAPEIIPNGKRWRFPKSINGHQRIPSSLLRMYEVKADHMFMDHANIDPDRRSLRVSEVSEPFFGATVSRCLGLCEFGDGDLRKRP